MVAKMSFRNHLILLLFLDIFIIMFIGLSAGTSTTIDPTADNDESSFLIDFILNPILSEDGGIFRIVLTLFIAISAIGVTSGSNFAGIAGVISSGLGVAVGTITKFAQAGVLIAVISDYWIVYSYVGGGEIFSMMRIIATVIFLPLIVDAIFASMDWMRGTNT